jgi:hypothetical protein
LERFLGENVTREEINQLEQILIESLAILFTFEVKLLDSRMDIPHFLMRVVGRGSGGCECLIDGLRIFGLKN